MIGHGRAMPHWKWSNISKSNRLSVVKPLDKFSSVCVCVFSHSILCCFLGLQQENIEQILYDHLINSNRTFASICVFVWRFAKKNNFPFYDSLTHLISDKQYKPTAVSFKTWTLQVFWSLCKQFFFIWRKMIWMDFVCFFQRRSQFSIWTHGK